MYHFVNLYNNFLREEILTNPFECISQDPIIALFASIIGSKLLYKLSFKMCGTLYKKGSSPIVGSIIYMLFWILNSYSFKTISQLSIIYILSLIAMYKILIIIIGHFYII